MRRGSGQISDQAVLLVFLEKADLCRIAFSSDGGSCSIPLNFGFEWNRALALYFHGANVGRELDRLRRGGGVGFEVDIEPLLRRDPATGDVSPKYRSLIGTGQLSEVADEEGRRRGLGAILAAVMRRYGFQGQPSYDQVSFQGTVVLRLDVETISGRPGPP